MLEKLIRAFIFSAIGRKNISPEKYKEAGEMLRKKNRSTLSETIVPLPKETLKSFVKGMMDLMDWKVSRIITNTVMFLHGTIYKDKKYIEVIKMLKKRDLFNKKHVVVIHREMKSQDLIDGYLNIIEKRIYGRSEIFFGKFF